MGISVADNFSYLGGKPLDGRIQYATLAAMKAMADATLYEGCEAYCVATDKYYKWKSSNTVDTDTGKWREVSSGGGQTYNDFTGATSSTAGAHGLVPAPSAGDEGKVLFGSGAWGALPSVDLSMLSNEANILSTTEKAVGMDTDGRLIYQKSVEASIPGGGDWTTVFSLGTSVKIVNYHGIFRITTDTHIVESNTAWKKCNCAGNYPQQGDFSVSVDSAGVFVGTIQYTKTTDSPLPAGVKFAGVTSTGEVIYEKTITGISVAVSSDWSTLLSNLSNVKDYISGHFYFGTSGDYSEYLPKSAQIINGTTLRIDGNGSSRTITKATIRYTLAS